MKIKTALMFLIVSYSAFAVDVNQVIERNLVLRGGVERLKTINSLAINAQVSSGNYLSSYNLMMKGDNRIKLSNFIDGEGITTVFNGDSAWVTDEVTGEVVKVTPAKVPSTKKQILSQYGIYRNVFLDYKDSGYTAVLYKTEILKDDSVYVVKLTAPEKSRKEDMYVYIHARTGLEYEIYTGKDPDNKKRGMQTVLRNNHITGNFVIPYSIETAKDGNLVSVVLYKTISINDPLDDSVFLYPSYKYTADDLVEKLKNAMGGEKAMKKLKNMKINALMVGSSAEAPEKKDSTAISYTRSFPEKIRMDMTKSGSQPVVFVIDDSTGWHKDPSTKNRAETLLKPMYNALNATLRSYFVFFDDMLLTCRQKGLKPEFVGEIYENGRKYYDLKVKLENGMEYFFFIDAQTFLINKRMNKTLASENYFTLWYGDYKNTSGLMVPYAFRADFEKAITDIIISKIEINTKIAKDLFNAENN